jgi:hypothetical protein
MGKLDGSCLCGNVTYSSDAEPLATAVCHCADCQKHSGGAFSIVVAVPRDSFKIEGEENLGSYPTVGTDHGQATARKFCKECGTAIVSVPDSIPEMVFIKAGSLEDRSWLEPQMQVWCDSAQPWVPIDGIAENKMPRGVGSAAAA